MNCKEFETLMPDALGDELSPQDRPDFESHLAACARCRAEYESHRRTIASLREVPGPKPVVLERVGDRFVLPTAPGARAARPPRRFTGGLRYAAGLLIAFTAGYAAHAGLTMFELRQSGPAATGQVAQTEPSGPTLESSLAERLARRPNQSDLANCLVALAPSKR